MTPRTIKSGTRTGTLNFNNKTYTLARSDVFYYLKFIDYNKEIFKTASNLTSKPTVVFYTEDTTDKVIYDYSLANDTDKAYLTSFFANLNEGDQFNLTNGSYLDKNELTANLGSTASFSQFVDNKIFATVVSVTSQNSALDVYDGDYFVGTPQLTKAGDLGTSSSTVNYALVSIAPHTNKPLSYLSPKVGDLFSVTNSDSANDGIKFQITEITTLNNQEIFKVTKVYNTDLPQTESLIGSASIIDLYAETQIDLSLNQTLDKTKLGCCRDLVTGQFYSSSTEYQCSLRTSGLYSYNTGECAPATTTLITTPATITVNNISYSSQTFPYLLTGDITELNVIVENGKFIIEPTADITFITNNTIELKQGKTYKFKQSDASNIGYPLRFTTSPNIDVIIPTPYVDNLYGIILPEGIGTELYLKTSVKTPSRLYMYTESNLGITSQVLFVTQ